MFGIDCGDRELLRSRPWSWLRSRILSLTDRPTQYLTYLSQGGERRIEIPTTRIGRVMFPPEFIA